VPLAEHNQHNPNLSAEQTKALGTPGIQARFLRWALLLFVEVKEIAGSYF